MLSSSARNTFAAVGLLVIGATAHAQVSTGSLAGWSTFGDVVSQAGRITMTTAYLDGDPAGDQPHNLSGMSAVDIGTLESAAGVATYGLDLSTVQYGTEGSLIKQTFGALAGQTLRFDWSFATFETQFLDRAFVVLNGVVTTLATTAAPGATTQTFARTLTTSGPVTLSFGVIDTVDYEGVSALTVGNLQLVGAIPEPATGALLLAGLLGVAGGIRQKRRHA